MSALPLKRGRIETGLIGRGLDGFQRRGVVELQSSGVPELDEVLGGGFPRGSLVELCGPSSSGRTSLAFSLLAQATDRQESCALVDVCDALDPMSLAAAGVELQRVLWVRCGETENGKTDSRSSFYFDPAQPVAEKIRAADSTDRKAMRVHGWGHPRESMRGVDTAIPRLVGKQAVAVEPQRIHVVSRCAGEQVERDRELPRRGIQPPRSLPSIRESYPAHADLRQARSTKPWKRLEQALKTTDLLLQSGGWGVVVFDLGGISWVDARRINLSMWFRFKRAVENTSTILLLVGEESCAKSCASVVLRCSRKGEFWSRAAGTEAGTFTFEGFEVQGEVTRSRVQSQPADLARWQTHTP